MFLQKCADTGTVPESEFIKSCICTRYADISECGECANVSGRYIRLGYVLGRKDYDYLKGLVERSSFFNSP